MRDTNVLCITGRLANGITLTTNGNGTTIGRFPLATTTSRKTANGWEDVSNFFDVTVFGSTAKNLADYLMKGKQVAVTGELHQDRWTDKQGGQHYGIYILATNVQLLGGNKNQQNQQNQQMPPQQTQPQQIQQQNPVQQQAPQRQIPPQVQMIQNAMGSNQAYIDNPPQSKESMINMAEAAYNANHPQEYADDDPNQELIW